MKKVLFCLSFILYYHFLYTQVTSVTNKTYNLEDCGIYKPYKMIVFENSVYLLDKYDFKITKIVDGKKIISFGQTGQGPNEYTIPIGFTMDNRKIHIQNVDGKKISFNLKGEWIETAKTNKGGSIFNSNVMLRMIGDNHFIARKMNFIESGDAFISYYYKNANFEKQLVRIDLSLDQIRFGQDNLTNLDSILFTVGGNYCFFTGDKTRFKVSAFNIKEEKLQDWIEIENYKRHIYSAEEIEMNERDKKEALRMAPSMLKDFLKNQVLPKYKPALQNLIADEKDRLYIFTNELKDGCHLTRIYNNSSRYINSIWLPAYKIIQASGDKVYLVVEEDDTFKLKIYTVF